MTHPISYKTLISARSTEAAPRTKSNRRQPTIQIPSLGSTLIGNKVCSMPSSPPQTVGLGPNRVALLNPNLFSHLVTKGLLHTDVASSAAQPKLRGQGKLPRGDGFQPTIAGGSMNDAACSPKPVLSKQPGTESPHCSARRSSGRDATAGSLFVQSNHKGAELPVDYRLLTVKLGGWGYESSNGVGSPHKEAMGTPRQKVSLHVAPRPLPGYLVKLVNQLMRHGRKGVSIGLLADSLILFCKRLEDGRRSKLHTASARSAILFHDHEKKTRGYALSNGNEPWISRPHGPHMGRGPILSLASQSDAFQRTGCIARQCTSIGSQGVPAFPFSLASFPGPGSGEMLPLGKEQSGRLLALPFSGALPPHFPSTRTSFMERGGEHRGLLGFEASQASQEQEPCPEGDPLVALRSDARAGASLNGLQGLNATRSLGGNVGPTRAEMGLRFHTKKPLYFWPMKGPPILASHPNGIKAQGSLPQASALSCINRAISNVEPSLEVRKKKIAGITRQIPCVVSKARGERLAIRWIINSARDRVKKRGKGLAYCLAEELTDAYHKRGEPRQRRDSLHKAAESNRSFLRYRWW